MSRSLAEKGWVPAWRWGAWWALLVVADVVFYILLTPIWLGIRVAAWIAEAKARLRPRR